MRARSHLSRASHAALAALILTGTSVVAVASHIEAVQASSLSKTALINGDSVTLDDGILDSSSNAISLEQFAAQAAGYSVSVVSGAEWDAMTAAQFAQYQLLIVGDPDCTYTPDSATSNFSTWAPVVMGKSGLNPLVGNRVVVGTDPEFHYARGGGGATPTDSSDPTTAGAEHLVQSGITYAGGVSGATGVYFDTSCYDAGSDLSLLNALSSAGSGFTEDTSVPCGGSVQLIASNPSFASLADSDIQGWGCSDHLTFPTYPADWQPLAVATDTATAPTCGTDPSTATTACGEAYVLVAGRGIVVRSPDISLSPSNGSDPIGTTHVVTATVSQGGSPLVGTRASFNITGQNAGVTGSCVPASCVTSASGRVKFTYSDTHGAGSDTIDASATISGTIEHASATEKWVPAYVALGDSFSSGEGNPPFRAGTAEKNVDECHRSNQAYPELLSLSPKLSSSRFSFLACSGAMLPDIVGASTTNSGQWHEAPQLNNLLLSGKKAITLVTISVGGNDLGFASDLTACVSGLFHLENSCQTSSQTRFDVGQQELTKGGDYTIVNDGITDTNKVIATCKTTKTKGCIATPSFRDLFRQIHADAPNAAIRVLGYPRIFPANPTKGCTVGTFNSIIKHSYEINASNMKFLSGLGDQANSLISGQVTAARKAGVPNIQYVPSLDAFTPHTLCSKASWFNGLMWSGRLLTDVSPYSFHPNAKGQQEFERLIAATL